MCKSVVLCVLLVLALVACAGSHEPATRPIAPSRHAITSSAVAMGTVAVPTPASSPKPGDTAARSTPAPTTPHITSAPTAEPTVPPPTATIRAEAVSQLPALLRQLDFGIPAGNGYNPRSLAVDPGRNRVYVRTQTRAPGLGKRGLVSVLDLSDGQVLDVVETGADDYSEGTLALDSTHNRLYVLNPGDASASVLNAETLDPIATLADVKVLAVDSEAARLYVAGAGNLRSLTLDSYSQLEGMALPAGWDLLSLIADPAARRLFLTHRGEPGYSLTVYDSASLARVGSVTLPGRPVAIQPDPGQHRLYVTSSNLDESLLWTLDSDGQLLGEEVLGGWTEQTVLALDQEGQRLFLGRNSYDNHGIAVMDLRSGDQVAQIHLEHSPSAMVWDGARGRLLISHTYDDRISVVTVGAAGLDDEVTAEYATARGLLDLAVDSDRSLLFVTDTTGWLHVLRSDGTAELVALPGEGLISVDSVHARLYTGGAGASRVRVYDSDTLQQTGEIQTKAAPVADAQSGDLYLVRQGIHLASLDTLTITASITDSLPQNPGFSPNPAAIRAVADPGSGRLYAIISNGVPGSNSGTYLYVYEPGSHEKVLSDTERSPWYLDVDPEIGRAYVSRSHIGSRSTSLLEDGREYTARVDALSGALAVDPGLGRLYLTSQGDRQGQLLVLDARNLDVLDSASIPGGYALQDVDTQQHLLYLATEDGKVQIWSATGGDRPPAADPIPTDFAAMGPLRVFLPPGGSLAFARDVSNQLYRSDDGGISWGRVRGGLPEGWVLDVDFSPGWEQDGTLFAALASADQGLGVWKSIDGGRSWRISSAGLSDLAVVDIAVAPTFDGHNTLFAVTRRGGLHRSTDGGQTWEPLAGRYRPPDSGWDLPGEIRLSPGYAYDQALTIRDHGQHVSLDGGDSWVSVVAPVSGYGFGQLLFSPWHAQDGTIHYLWIPVEPAGRALIFSSVDSGSTWSNAIPGPAIGGYGAGRVLVAPDGMIYLFWRPSSGNAALEIYRSPDFFAPESRTTGASWEAFSGEALQVSTAIELATDGARFAALDDAARLVRWPVAGLPWEPMAAQALESVPASPSPSAIPTPKAAGCATQPGRFRDVWQQADGSLGCPTLDEAPVLLAEQPFERGRMIWDSSTSLIYVLEDSGEWASYPDSFVEGVDPSWDAELAPPPQQPQRGFGKIWREQLGGSAAAIGWALEVERPVDGWRHTFEGGLLIWSHESGYGADGQGVAYLFYDDNTWQAFRAPLP